MRRATDTGELGDFSKMKIALPDGTQVPISQVAQLSLREAPQNVVRVDLQRSVEIHIQAESRARQKRIRQALPEIFSSTRSADLGGSFRFQVD